MSSTLATVVANVRLNNCWRVSAFALLVYDYIVTFPTEVEHVWFAPWNVGKILFLINRYLPFTDLPPILYEQFGTSVTILDCRALYWWTSWSFSFGIFIADVILGLRTWVIWGRTRTWAVVILTIFLCAWIPSPIIVGLFLESLKLTPSTAPGVYGCTVIGASNIFYAVWLIAMLYEFLIFCLTAVRVLYHHRVELSPLMRTLYFDGLMFSACLFVVSIANVAVLVGATAQLTNLLSTIQRVLHSVLAGRVLLHLREVARRYPEEALATSWELQPASPFRVSSFLGRTTVATEQTGWSGPALELDNRSSQASGTNHEWQQRKTVETGSGA